MHLKRIKSKFYNSDQGCGVDAGEVDYLIKPFMLSDVFRPVNGAENVTHPLDKVARLSPIRAWVSYFGADYCRCYVRRTRTDNAKAARAYVAIARSRQARVLIPIALASQPVLSRSRMASIT
jgi:hypothetical protein